jgi:3-methylcrotonyl-CoA carboxylase beta subunit
MTTPKSPLSSSVDPQAPAFQAARKAMEERLAAIRADETRIAQGGGAKAIERQHEKGRLTARERVAKLIDRPG